ncbi:MAG TPA: head-tail connector protein [Alphaproteobacteria bacterium]|nr:head-tail connector protein [Alphaproteobacteria bacterium]
MLECLNTQSLLPLSINLLKTHLRLDHGQDDLLLESLIQTAAQWVELYLGQTLVKKTYKETFKCNENLREVVLSKGPLLSIESVKATDKTTIFDLRSYDLVKKNGFTKLLFKKSVDQLVVFYEVGMALSSGELPAVIKHALLLLAAEFYEKGSCMEFSKTHPVLVLLKPFESKRLF